MGGIINEFEVTFGFNLRKTNLKHGECYFLYLFDDYIAAKASVILLPNFTDYAILY